MKIGLITYSISARSGARAPLRLAEFLQKLGNQVTILAYSFNKDQELVNKLEKDGIKLHIFKTNDNPKIPFPFRGYLTIPKLTWEIKKGNFDVISFHGTLPQMVAARLSGKKILTTYYGTELSYSTIREQVGEPLKLRFWNKISDRVRDLFLIFQQKQALKMADGVVSISKFLALEAKNLFNIETEVIYLGSESVFFNQNLKSNKEENYFLAVSRLVPYKGFDFLIKSFRQIASKRPDLRLVIVGQTSDQGYLDYLNSLNAGNVSILTNVNDEELRKLYSSCLAYISCDLWVPWSLTPLEASIFKKPLSGFEAGAMPEIIKNNLTGLLAPRIKDLPSLIIKLAADAKLREKLGRGAQLRVKEFSWEKTAEAYQQEFKKLLKTN